MISGAEGGGPQKTCRPSPPSCANDLIIYCPVLCGVPPPLRRIIFLQLGWFSLVRRDTPLTPAAPQWTTYGQKISLDHT